MFPASAVLTPIDGLLSRYSASLKDLLDNEIKLFNHINYNSRDCDWFKTVLLSTNSLAKLLSDSLF